PHTTTARRKATRPQVARAKRRFTIGPGPYQRASVTAMLPMPSAERVPLGTVRKSPMSLARLRGETVDARLWTPVEQVESQALTQLRNIASLPWVAHVAV